MSAHPIPPLQEHIDRAQDYGAREEAIEEANVRENIRGGQEFFFYYPCVPLCSYQH